ncbi:MAG: hypothetical protein H0T73_22110, partial [Ardenticatenales bacterium]|nr:hypothetical protein [Ardenticatenales bacterium]
GGPVTPPPTSMPLPPHLARGRPPNVEGEVEDTREIQVKAPRNTAAEVVRYTFAIILLPFRPMMVLLAWIFGGRRPTELQTVYLVRVRCVDGTVRQLRIEHEIAGATLDIGDYVSVWGHDRSGVLIVQHAYNHTVGAEVKPKSSGSILNQLLLVFLLCFVLYALIALLSTL